MFKKILILVVLVLCFSALSEVKAQTLFKDDKTPKDLVITYESIGRFCHYELKVNSDRKVFSNMISCLPLPQRSLYESLKKDKKLSKKKFEELISEFKLINFFKLDDEYSTNKNSCSVFITDSGATKISIQFNGKIKQVYYENGCFNDKDKTIEKLKELGEKIKQVRNEVKILETKVKSLLQNGEIPKDLVITLERTFNRDLMDSRENRCK